MLFNRTTIAALVFAFATATLAGQYPGYVTDSSGKLAHDSYGRCVKTGTWTSENLIPECGGKAPVVAPKAEVTPAPAIEAATVKPLEPTPAIVEQPLKPEVKTIETRIEKAVPITLSAQVLFGFDEYKLSNGGTELLTSVVQELKKVDYKTINLDGYTDRFGSTKYNLKLSVRRANTVKTFLVNHGIDASKIKAVGYGKTNFVTTVADCKAFKGEGLKACYSQDRRVMFTLE